MKDYARKSTTQKVQTASNGLGIVAIMVISCVLFVGYASYHFLHDKINLVKENITAKPHTVTHNVKKPIEKKVIHTEKPKHAERKLLQKKDKIASLNPKDIQPKYDFYKLLPAMKVEVPNENVSSKPTAIPSPA